MANLEGAMSKGRELHEKGLNALAALYVFANVLPGAPLADVGDKLIDHYYEQIGPETKSSKQEVHVALAEALANYKKDKSKQNDSVEEAFLKGLTARTMSEREEQQMDAYLGQQIRRILTEQKRGNGS